MNISKINIYPIKSLKGISLTESTVEPRGLRFDRRWLLLDSEGKFLTQREIPKMATVAVAIDVDGDGIIVSADGQSSMKIEPLANGGRSTVTVWGSQSEAIAYGGETDEWFSDALGAKVQLVYMPDDAGRPVNPIFAKNGEKVSFADGYPLLVIGDASLEDLNSRLERRHPAGSLSDEEAGKVPAFRLPMNRFRPNIVVSGSDAFAEDGWSKIRVGDVVFRSTKLCARCVMTTVDRPGVSLTVKSRLKTLAEYRKAKMVIPDRFERFGMNENDVCFGQNLVPENAGVSIKVGDAVEVVEKF